MLDAACDAVGRDPATVWRTLGLYALCGEDERDLERRFERLQATSPPGVLDGVDLDTFRQGRLVGTVERCRSRSQAWEAARRRDAHRRRRRGAVPGGGLDDLELLGRPLAR